MYTLGALLLSALLLGAVISVIESVLQVVGAHGVISKLPIIGAHLSLIIAIGMVWLLDMNPIAGWGVSFSDEWMTYVANGAIIPQGARNYSGTLVADPLGGPRANRARSTGCRRVLRPPEGGTQ
jgi:hypothetical protein